MPLPPTPVANVDEEAPSIRTALPVITDGRAGADKKGSPGTEAVLDGGDAAIIERTAPAAVGRAISLQEPAAVDWLAVERETDAVTEVGHEFDLVLQGTEDTIQAHIRLPDADLPEISEISRTSF